MTGPAEADMATYTVEIATMDGNTTRTLRAAYMTTEPGRPGEPGWLIFRDSSHDIVAQFNASHVVMAQRGTGTVVMVTADEEQIRAAMAEAQDHPGRVITR